MIRSQLILDIADELLVSLFAGMGGWCHAMERATGRHVDIACNHNPDAVAGHRINHPQTKHYICDVYELDPVVACKGRRVGWLHLSPDCTHFSQASSGQPRDSKIRSLLWVALMWAGKLKRAHGRGPRIISLENVKQIRKLGPLVAKRCKETGRVIKLDENGKVCGVAAPGEVVPRNRQFLIPDPRREGEGWAFFKRELHRLGSQWIDDRDMVASDFGARTSRNRLFMLARTDVPPVFPSPSHVKQPQRGQRKILPVWEVLDFTRPCPSIFNRPKPLAEATHRRIAKGIVQFVLEHADPFIVPVTHTGSDRVHSVRDPLRTITTAKRGELMLSMPTLIQMGYGERPGQKPRVLDLKKPLGTVVGGGLKHAACAAFLAQFNAGKNTTAGHDARKPLSTTSVRGTQQQLCTAHLAHLRGNCDGRDVRDPLKTISANGQHHAVVECTLAPEQEAGALRVAAFLMRYYSNGGQWGDLRKPLSSVTTKDRLALVTVTIEGTAWVIVDIGLRMLFPDELFLAMGFSPEFIIDRGLYELADGTLEERKFSKTTQVRLCGNAVSPPPAEALILANAPELSIYHQGERAEVMAVA
ncbi:MAG TPA: DNA cytosine methyltransferase [Opitutaceae bacterium]|nr:DNA cytosine methyltransferase [Opitutaceae bacterium]